MNKQEDQIDRIQAEWGREEPDIDVTPQGVFGRLARLSSLVHQEICSTYEQHGITEADFDVMATLRRAGKPFERRATELAEHTMVTSGGLTKRVDRLIGLGFVERRLGEHDARERVIGLTPEGKRVLDAAFRDHMANEKIMLDRFTAREREILPELLKTWLAHYE